KSAGNVSEYSGDIIFEGQTTTVTRLANSIGWSDYAPRDLADTNNAGPMLADFLNEYAQLQESGALQDPAVRKLVHTLTSQIAGIAESVQYSSTQIESDNAM